MRTQYSQINIFKRRKRLIGLQARCQFDSVHPGGSRGKSLSLSFLSWDAACIPWFMVSFFIFKVSSVAILSAFLSSFSLSPSLWLWPSCLPLIRSQTKNVKNQATEFHSTPYPQQNLSFLYLSASQLMTSKYIISMLKPNTLKSFLSSLFHVLQPMQMSALSVCSYKYLYTMFIAALFVRAPHWKHLKSSSTGEGTNKVWYISISVSHNGILCCCLVIKSSPTLQSYGL